MAQLLHTDHTVCQGTDCGAEAHFWGDPTSLASSFVTDMDEELRRAMLPPTSFETEGVPAARPHITETTLLEMGLILSTLAATSMDTEMKNGFKAATIMVYTAKEIISAVLRGDKTEVRPAVIIAINQLNKLVRSW